VTASMGADELGPAAAESAPDLGKSVLPLQALLNKMAVTTGPTLNPG